MLAGGGAAAALSLLYATQGGLYLLDTVDYFINNFGIAFVGLVEVVTVAWFLRALARLRRHANAVSDIDVGMWWVAALAVVTPLLLGYQLVETLRGTLAGGYSGYPVSLLAVGWSVALAALAAGFALTLTRWDEQVLDAPNFAESTDHRARQESR